MIDDYEFTPQATEPPRHALVAGYSVGGPFRAFYEHYGPTLCGLPISDVTIENGVRSQYFQCLALEEHEPGRVRVKALGETVLALQRSQLPVDPVVGPQIIDLADHLRRDPTQRYATRPLSDIRYLVIHHTGAPVNVSPEIVAAEHVERNGWPGIGYHFLVDPIGNIYRTQDLTTVGFHARQFNSVAVGVALIGDLSSTMPMATQLDATASLVARLLLELGLPPESVRGHREMVPTACPGESFLRVWKPALMQAVNVRLGQQAAARAAAVATIPAASV